MSCFSCISPGRKDVRDYDEDMASRSVDASVIPKGKAFSDRKEVARQSGSFRDRNKENHAQKGNVARSFTFKELATATQNFREANLIGEGGFGCVYKGRLESGIIVAIKQLNLEGLQGNQEFIVEVLMLSLLHHPNLVNLIGYCTDGDQRLLVYEYMPLGSLENHLFDLDPGMEPLSWSTRLKIAVGAARGLQYLHCSANPPVIYRDLKSDIYSFGVVLLELITGRKAIDCTKKPGEQNLVVWSRPFLKDRRKFVQMVDPLLEGRFPVRCLHHAIAIAAMCLQEQPSFRPIIDDIVVALEYLACQADSQDSYNNRSTNAPISSSSPGPDANHLGPRKRDFVNLSAAF